MQTQLTRQEIMEQLMDKNLSKYSDKIIDTFGRYLSNLAYRYKLEKGFEKFEDYEVAIRQKLNEYDIEDIFYKAQKIVVILNTTNPNIKLKFMASGSKVNIVSVWIGNDYRRENIKTSW